MREYRTSNSQRTISKSFYKSILEAIEQMPEEQDEIEIPDSGGQMLVRAGCPAAKTRSDLIKTVDCAPFQYEGKKYLICVK